MNEASKVFHTKAHARMAHEKYYTPAWVTWALLNRAKFSQAVWEPAAGAGDMAQVLGAAGYAVEASDVAPEHPWVKPCDFLNPSIGPVADIVTNPPFGTGGRLAVAFVERALQHTRARGGRIAMLLRDDFDSAKGRRHLFGDCAAFHHKLVLTTRIRWVNLPQMEAGPSGNHAWFLWDWSRDAKMPTVSYADDGPPE